MKLSSPPFSAKNVRRFCNYYLPTTLKLVRSYNEVLVTEGKSDVRTVYAVPQFTIPDDKLLVIELFEKDGGRHQTIRVENADLVAARQINELKIK